MTTFACTRRLVIATSCFEQSESEEAISFFMGIAEFKGDCYYHHNL